MICPCCAQILPPVALQSVIMSSRNSDKLAVANCKTIAGPVLRVQAMCPLPCSFPLLQSKRWSGMVIKAAAGHIGVVTLCRWAGHGCSLHVLQPWQCWWRGMVRCAPWCCAMGGWPAWPPCCTLLEPRARKQPQKPSRHALHHLHSFVTGCYASNSAG